MKKSKYKKQYLVFGCATIAKYSTNREVRFGYWSGCKSYRLSCSGSGDRVLSCCGVRTWSMSGAGNYSIARSGEYK
jgi:hypothetical protein